MAISSGHSACHSPHLSRKSGSTASALPALLKEAVKLSWGAIAAGGGGALGVGGGGFGAPGEAGEQGGRRGVWGRRRGVGSYEKAHSAAGIAGPRHIDVEVAGAVAAGVADEVWGHAEGIRNHAYQMHRRRGAEDLCREPRQSSKYAQFAE